MLLSSWLKTELSSKRHGGLRTYSFEGVLSGALVKTALNFGMLRESSKDAYPRARFLREDEDFPLTNIGGDKNSVFLWRAKSDSSLKREELTYYSELDASISHELSAATDLGLNLSFLYNKKEKKFTSFQNELLDRFSDESLSDSLGSPITVAYENNAFQWRRIKLLLESFL